MVDLCFLCTLERYVSTVLKTVQYSIRTLSVRPFEAFAAPSGLQESWFSCYLKKAKHTFKTD